MECLPSWNNFDPKILRGPFLNIFRYYFSSNYLYDVFLKHIRHIEHIVFDIFSYKLMCSMCLCVSKKRHTMRSKNHIRNWCYFSIILSCIH